MKIFFDTEFHEYKKQPKFLGFKAGDKIDTIDLISIGLVREDGRTLYLLNKDCDLKEAFKNDWLVANIFEPIFIEWSRNRTPGEKYFYNVDFSIKSVKHIFKTQGFSKAEICQKILDFVGDAPEFWAYYADYDWVVLCWLFGRMIDLPKHFPYYCKDLKQLMDDKANSLGISVEALKRRNNFPKNPNEHNALADAVWNKQVYEWLNTKS